ncbi:hypothetical protein D3C75_776660 [compost metagenome]
MNREQLLAHRIMQIPGHTPALFKYRTLRCLFLLDHFLLAQTLQQLHFILHRVHHHVEFMVDPCKRLVVALRHPNRKIAFSHLEHIQIQMIYPPLNPLAGHISDNYSEQHDPHAEIQPHAVILNLNIAKACPRIHKSGSYTTAKEKIHQQHPFGIA